MSIDRGPFNALVDDDGSGTRGTPWNKAQIQNVILDPVDAAIAAAPGRSLTALLYSGAGSATGAADENITGVTIPPGMTTADTIELFWDVWVAGPHPGSAHLALYGVGINSTFATLVDIGSGPPAQGPALAGYGIGSYRIVIRASPPAYPDQFLTTVSGVVTFGATQALGAVFMQQATMQRWTQPWSLYLQQIGGMPAGTPLQWNAQVYAHRTIPMATTKPGEPVG